MPKHDEKNIQLSEKIEYLMANGKFTVSKTADGKTVFIYINESLEIFHYRKSGRVIDFVNNVVEKFGLYPLVQKFHRNGVTPISDKQTGENLASA